MTGVHVCFSWHSSISTRRLVKEKLARYYLTQEIANEILLNFKHVHNYTTPAKNLNINQLTSISFVTGIDDPGQSQAPHKTTESAVNDILSLGKWPAVFFIARVNTIHGRYTMTYPQEPSDQTNRLSWYPVLEETRNQVCEVY